MQKRALGTGGPDISAIGIGAMLFTAFYGAVNEENCHATLDAALEFGIKGLGIARGNSLELF